LWNDSKERCLNSKRRPLDRIDRIIRETLHLLHRAVAFHPTKPLDKPLDNNQSNYPFCISRSNSYTVGPLQTSSVLPGSVPQPLFFPKPFHLFYDCMCLGDPRQQGLKAVADPLPGLYSLCLRLLLPGRLLRNCLLCRIFYQLSTVCCLVRWFAVVLVFRSLNPNC